MSSARDSRLRQFLNAVLHGEKSVATQGPLFLEAICANQDHAACISYIISSDKGLSSLQEALQSSFSVQFFNGPVTTFLQYIQAPALKKIGSGQFLAKIINTIVDPPIFWTKFHEAFCASHLQETSQQCFAWLLLQVILMPTETANLYRKVAEDQLTLSLLSSLPSADGKALALKIQKIIATSTIIDQSESGFGPGGRHDNDFVDFRKIAILPTGDEIFSTDRPFLRPSSALEEPGMQDVKASLYLDNQFRLLREDMLHEMREELQIILNTTKRRNGRGWAIDGLTIFDVHCGADAKRCKWGLALKCAVDLPQLKGQKGFEKRRSYLTGDTQGKKILRHQSLACLFVDGKVSAFPTINREEALLAQEPPIIVLQFDGQSSVTKTLMELKTAKATKLIQVNTAIFSYKPVLAALQNIQDIPLSRELLFWRNGLDVDFVEHGPKMASLVRHIKFRPHQDLSGHLGSSKSIILDQAQEASLLSGLTQTVSLIQGPPGTGKSFIGAILAKFLHDYSEQTILVVCYTNHALDQFLEDLLGIGIPEANIVRLGGKFNLKTEPMSLRKQDVVSKNSHAHWSLVDACKATAEISIRSLKSAFDDYKMASGHDADIMAHIEFEDHDFFQAFSVPVAEDGMTQIGRQGRAVDTYYLLNQWSSGKDAGMFNKHPHVLGAAAIWTMPLAARQAQVAKWKMGILKYQVKRICETAEDYDKCQLELARLFEQKNVDILRSKRIIGCTTTGAAKYQESIQNASPDILLVEEAGEILESHVIIALGADAKQMILIGDHKQLRPKVNHYALTVEKGDGYDLNRSLFERLVLKGYPHTTLINQHRMRPEISALIRHLTYPDLTDASGTSSRPNVRGVRDNIIFINHTQPEDENNQLADRLDMDSKSSKQNTFEAEMVLKVVRYLVQQGYKSEELVVLTPYLGQLKKLQEVLSRETHPVLNDMDMNELIRAGVMTALPVKPKKLSLRLVTIDNYQGEESDIVITSLCRSNLDNDIGFMCSPERLNVLLSRARNALVMVGNAKTFTNARKGKALWERLLRLLRDGGHVYDGFPVICCQHSHRTALLKAPADFDTECPDGGCNNPCGIQLNCRTHTCSFKCHPSTFARHDQMLCQQIVEEVCPNGHCQFRKCHLARVPCKECARDAKLAEEKRQKEFELQEKRKVQRVAHEQRLKDIQERIDAQEQIMKDVQLAEQRAQVIRQKKEDLKNIQDRATSMMAAMSSLFSFFPSFPSSQSSQAGPSTSSKGTANASPPVRTLYAKSPPESHHQSTTVNSQSLLQQPRPPFQHLQTLLGDPSTNALSPEAEWQRQKDSEGASSAAIDTVMGMVGLEDVKMQMLRIKDKIEVNQRQNTSLKDERFNVVLLGNPGTGKTTVARQYARFLTSQQLLPGYAFKETTGALLAHEGVASAKTIVDEVVNAGGGAIFIDEAYQLTSQHGQTTHQGSQVLDFLLAEMENRVGVLIFILAGYSKQMETFFEHNPGLPSRVPYTLKFGDYTDDELLRMLSQLIHKKYNGHMKVEDGPMGLYSRIAVRRLAQGRGREGFGNIRALQNMFAKITERQAERISFQRRQGQKPDDFLMVNQDIIGLDPAQAIKKSTAWTELQSLTGLQSVKESVHNLFDLISVNYRRELAEQKPMQMSLNRVFLGSPGTGKTTVGKLYGQILADIGMLSNGEVVVKNPADFVGRYIGQSEANTKAILASTVGKVLIIDEAYMLFGGGHGKTDTFKTAVIDTIVAEVQSVPGEDRCILLLGYDTEMREMFRNVNPGLSRRFSIEEAFKFEDFTDTELREILDSKLRKQDLAATDAAKDVAMELLKRERTRPNFGNGGAVESLLGHTKSRYMARIRGSTPPTDTIFEPQDFDPEFDRHLHAAANLDKMFEDIIGCEHVLDKLREYQKICRVMKARGEDTHSLIPTNFVFKGPPGTGKTTIARKIGQVYYDMGFLSSAKVEECSASDLVGQYAGHTGPKTMKLFEKALGQVLFIDEAYRLGDGRFAQEAVDELVGLLTQERFKSKIVVILAGYEHDINKLLSVNSGLSSRFPEIISFRNVPPKACLEILDKRLRQNKIMLAELHSPSSKGYLTMISVVEDLSALPSWGNARDIETLARNMSSLVLKQLPDSGQAAELTMHVKGAIDVMILMLDERRARANMRPRSHSGYEDMLEELPLSSAPSPPPPTQEVSPPSPPPSQQWQKPVPPAPAHHQNHTSRPPLFLSPSTQQSSSIAPRSEPPTPNRRQNSTSRPPPFPSSQQRPQETAPPLLPKNSTPSDSASRSQPFRPPSSRSRRPPLAQDQRDPGISNNVWRKLQADKQALEEEARQQKERLRQATEDENRKRAAADAAQRTETAAKDLAAREAAQRRRDELRRSQQAAAAARQRIVDELKEKKAREERVQAALRQRGVCVQGYAWVRQTNGYRCRGGAHFVPHAQLDLGSRQ